MIDNTVLTHKQSASGFTVLGGVNNYLAENTAETYGIQGHGIFFQDTVNATAYDNTLSTHGSNGAGVIVRGQDNHILYNTISTEGDTAVGVFSYEAECYDNDIIGNTITTSGPKGLGLYLQSARNNQYQYNDITTSGDKGYGICAELVTENNTLYGNTIKTNNSSSTGIYIVNSFNNTLYDNDITIEADLAHGIHIKSSTNHSIDGGSISTAWNLSHGIFITGSNNNTITNVKIDTMDHNATGIILQDAKTNMVYNNVITTKENTSVGMQFWPNTHENYFANNVISTSGTNATGILVGESTNTTVMNNTVTTTGYEGHGMIFYKSMHQALYLNNITTWGSNLSGVMLVIDTINTTVSNIKITGHGNSSRGIQLHEANDTFIVDAIINLTDPQTAGVFFMGNGTPGKYRALMVNSNIITPGGRDFQIGRDANMTLFNTTFNTVEAEQDGGGVLQVYNPLYIQAYFKDGTTPLSGADIRVQDNGGTFYASSGYSGTDAQTDANGHAGMIIVPDRWYIYNNTAKENITSVSVKRTIDASWEEVRSDVDMSYGHTEVFVANDLTAPATPSGLKVERVGTTNDVTISWDANVDLDIDKYTIESNKSGSWQEITSVNHPTVSYSDQGLKDKTWYFYRIRAWDTANIPSPYTTVVSIFLGDVTPPDIPTGFTVQPVAGGDALSASWDANVDDTVRYELLFSDSPTGPFFSIENITHPQTSVTGGVGDVVHGETYYFKLRAWDANGNPSDNTSVVSVVHQDYLAPEAPPSINAETLSEYSINVTWTASSDDDVQGYRLYINITGETDAFTLVNTFDTNTFFHVFTDLSENTTYYFVVDSFDEADNENRSEVAQATTDAEVIIITPPATPSLDTIPKYTNNAKLNVTGTADPSIDIEVYIDDTEVGSTASDPAGKFWIEIDLNEGSNAIKARAFKLGPVYSEYSAVMNVILDTIKPIADAGADVEIKPGDTVTFNASGSTDNLGIANYSWSFDDGTRASVRLYGLSAQYRFDVEGSYEVALTILDLAGNSDTDSMKVTVKKVVVVERPRVTATDPAPGAVDVPLNSSLTITFSMSMDRASVLTVFDMEPKLLFDINWTENNTVFRLDFRSDFDYGTTYNITIGNAKAANGQFLEDAPYVFNFTTVEEVIIPVEPDISITPLPEANYEPGKSIVISGATTAIDEGENVTVTVNGETYNAEVGADGSWSVSVTLPDEEGTYTITVKIGDETETSTVTVKEPSEKEEEPDNTMMYLALLIVIIVIVVVVLLVMRRKKPPAEAAEEEAEEEVEEEEEIEEDVEEEEEGEEEAEAEEEPEEEAEEEEPEEEELTEEDVEEEEIEDFEEEPDIIKTVSCPKCDSDIDVPESDGPKVSLECKSCGAKGRIKNPYL
jgi:plastocyanin